MSVKLVHTEPTTSAAAELIRLRGALQGILEALVEVPRTEHIDGAINGVLAAKIGIARELDSIDINLLDLREVGGVH